MHASQVPPSMDRNERRRRDRLRTKLLDIHDGESKKSLAERSAFFFKNVLFSERPRLARNVHVTVRVKKDLGAMGYCDYDEYGRSPRDFRIAIHAMCERPDVVETVAHEMVHVWQFATDRLVDLANGDSKYDGHKYCRSDMTYGEYPWEVEAYALEEELVRLWIKHCTEEKSVAKSKRR